MAITALPALDRTGATFRADVDTFFDSQLPTFSVEVEAARVAIVAAEATASAAAATATAKEILTNADAIATAADRVQTGLDRTSATNSAAAAAASAAVAAGAAAFVDTNPVVKGSSDATKQVRFEVDGLTTATTRVLTVPDADMTLVGADTAQTLANKTLTSPTLSTEAVTVTTNNLPALHPSLNLDFANGRTVDPRITFTRASTATRVNAKGLIETVASGVPRIDYDPVTLACKGLLIEEARTNLLTYSEQFDNAAWTKVNSTITANALTAPDGTLTADKHVENSTLSYHPLMCNPSVTSGVTYTVSRYFKAGGRSEVFLGFDTINSAFTYQYGRFNLNTGVATTYLGSPVLSMVNCGNGWYRCSVTATATATATASISQQLIGTPGAADGSYTGDGTSGVYIWGAQLEAGAFATSYIPTTSAQVTRAADVATMTGTNFSDWYRQDEGSFVCDWAQALTTSTADTFGLYRVTGTDGALPIISARVGYSGTRKIRSFAQDTGSVFEYTTDGGTEASSSGRHSLTYAPTNDFATSSSGAAAITDTSGSITDFSCNTLQIGVGTTQLNGHIARLAYYPKRLTNVELQALSA